MAQRGENLVRGSNKWLQILGQNDAVLHFLPWSPSAVSLENVSALDKDTCHLLKPNSHKQILTSGRNFFPASLVVSTRCGSWSPPILLRGDFKGEHHGQLWTLNGQLWSPRRHGENVSLHAGPWDQDLRDNLRISAQPSSNGASSIDNLRDLVSGTSLLWVHFHVDILFTSVYWALATCQETFWPWGI